MLKLCLRRFLWATGMLLCTASAGAADERYEFGVFPYLPVTKIHELYGPMAADFEKKLGRPVRLSSMARYASFAEELRREVYDIAFVQPFDYVDAHDHHGYLPLARRPGGMAALIVVREDSPLRTLKDLGGRTVANPPMDAAVSYLTNMALWEAGIDPSSGVRRDYGRNHFTCLQSVAIGAADACGTAEQPYRILEKQNQAATQFRILYQTVRIPNSAIVVHKRMPKAHRDLLLKTVVDWPKTEEGKKILERGPFAAFIVANDAEYEVVRHYIQGRK